MVKYYSRFLLLMTIAIISIFISVPVFSANWTDCSLPDKPNTCFKTASQYKFEIVDTGSCLNPATRLGIPVNSFPYFMTGGYPGGGDANLWCYQVTPPAKGVTNSSISQVDLQVAVQYFYPTPVIVMDSSGQVFPFNLSNGCSGDSTTGFEVGDLDACGIKWTYRINPGSGPQRFSFMTKVTPETHDLGKGPVILAAKVGSAVEPGIILGPDSSSGYSAIGMPHSVCQVVAGLPYYFKKDDVGCTESVYVCHGSNTNCEGTFDDVNPYPTDYSTWTDLNTCFKLQPEQIKMTMKRLDTGEDITSVPKTLREVGFVGGNNACREGIITGKGGSPPCTVTTSAGGRTLRTTYYTTPPCP